jgi:hypothetical protein
MYVATRTRTYKGKTYTSSQIVEGYRTPEGKVRQRTIVDITRLGPEKIAAIKAALQAKAVVDWENIAELESKDYGIPFVVKEILDRCGLPEVLGEEGKKHWGSIAAMITNRIDEPVAKYSLKHWAANTVLSELYTVKDSAFSHKACYEAMDYLEEAAEGIEEALYARRRSTPRLFFYDLTSVYFEGRKAELGAFGYSRDKRGDRPQVTIGLLTDKDGLPVSVEVYSGNTRDAATVKGRLDELVSRFDAKSACFVGDRGMRTQANIETIRESGFDFILALNHREVLSLVEKHGPTRMSLFDEMGLAETVIDDRRLIVCRNPVAGADTKRRREELVQLSKEALGKIKETVKRGRLIRPEAIQRRVDQALFKYKTEKFFSLEIKEGSLEINLNKKVIEAAEQLDGVYVIETSLSEDEITKEEVQSSYKTLQVVERAFRIAKNNLEIRPVYHWKKERIRAHVFICFLAYLVEQTIHLSLRSLSDADKPEWNQFLGALRGFRRISVPQDPRLKPKFTGFTPELANWLQALEIKLA